MPKQWLHRRGERLGLLQGSLQVRQARLLGEAECVALSLES
jgi:hypothetical protein